MADHDPLTAGDAARSFYEAYAAHVGKPRWGDKSPPYTWKAKRIQRALPEAQFIHLIRDGRDVALSLSEVSWGPGDIQAAAAKWVDELGRARSARGDWRPGPTWSSATRTWSRTPSPSCGGSPTSSTCPGTTSHARTTTEAPRSG